MGRIVIGSPSLFGGLSIEEREDTGQCVLSLVARSYHFLRLRTNRQLQDHTFLAIVRFLFPPIQPFFLGHPRTHTHSQHRVRPHNPERPFSVAANRPPCVSFLQSRAQRSGSRLRPSLLLRFQLIPEGQEREESPVEENPRP